MFQTTKRYFRVIQRELLEDILLKAMPIVRTTLNVIFHLFFFCLIHFDKGHGSFKV